MHLVSTSDQIVAIVDSELAAGISCDGGEMFPRVEDEPLSGLILGTEASGWG